MPASKEKAPVKKELKTEKEKAPVKKELKTEKEKAPVKKSPKFEAKEMLMLDGKECVFVERVKGKILVRFIEGGYASAEESKFTIK